MDQTKRQKHLHKEDSSWKNLLAQVDSLHEDDYPLISIVIPTLNSAHTIGSTLDSIKEQMYPEIQIIIIDACSTDRTLEIIKSYDDLVERIYSVSNFRVYEMLNRGISLCHGRYINFLYPGDYYIGQRALLSMVNVIIDNEYPDLVYTSCILRDESREAKLLLRPLTIKTLMRGQQPTSIQSTLFRIDSIKKIGKFQIDYYLRGGHELFCRFAKKSKVRIAVSHHVMIDSHHNIDYTSLIRKSTETFRVIYYHFGLRSALKWWLVQNHFRFIRWWLKVLKSMFLGKH